MEKLISLDVQALEAFGNSPEEILKEDIALQIAVASHPDTLRNVLEVLANSENLEVAEAAQMHVNYAGELTEAWQDAVENKLKSRYLGQNDRLAVELLKIAPLPVYFLSEYVPPEYLIQGLNHPYLSKSDCEASRRHRTKLLARLAQEPTLEPRLQVAESPDTPPTLLEQLIGDLELSIRIAVEYNPNCSSGLVELVKGQHRVASNWDTDSQQLDNLSDSNWDWIRLAVAQNPSSAEETLLKLAGDKVFRIQLAVAKNPITSSEVLAVLSEHSSKEIQAEVAKHPNATEEILHSLFDTQQGVIKSRDNLSTRILEKIFNESPKDSEVPLFLSRSGAGIDFYTRQPNTPTWILAEFAEVDIEKLTVEKLEKEQKRGSSLGIHKEWVSDEIKPIINLAKHPQVSTEILEQILQYPNLGIKLAVAQNQKISPELRLQLLEELIQNESERRIVIQTKINIAADTNTPSAILEKLASKLSSISSVLTKLGQIIPNASKSLIDKITEFINRHQSPEQILFWSRQDEAFRTPILNDWQEIIDSLDETETQQLKGMAMMMMPAIGMSGGVPRQDRVWLSQGLENKSINQADFLQNLPPTYSLYGLLMLIGMSHQNDRSGKAIVTALLGNPSTPASIRDRLWERYREKSEDNRRVKDASLRLALGFNSAIPENQRQEYLEQALSSGYSNIREAIAKNPLTPLEILERIANRGLGGLQQVVKNPNCPVHLLQKTVEEINNSSGLSHTLVEVAKNPNTPVILLKKLALSKGSYGVIETVLNNPNLNRSTAHEIQLQVEEAKEIRKANQILAKRTDSPYALARVLETGDLNAKISAAKNRKTPIQVLKQLAKDEDKTVRQIMAQNKNLPLDILLELADDSSVIVRSNLAYKNTHSKIKTSVELLEKLARDESETVREKVAAHSDTPEEILIQLANDSSTRVKKALTGNLNTPVTVLNHLGLEENLVNQRNPNTPGEVLASRVNNFLRSPRQNDPRWKNLESTNKGLVALLKHPVKGTQMPADTLAELANHHYSPVRYRVAAHPNTPTYVLEKLARDSYVATIRAVASNVNTPPSALEYLANNGDLTTRISIVRHPNTPPEVLARMVEDAQTSANAPNRTKDSLKSAVAGNAYDLLRAIAASPKTPINALAIIAQREFASPPPNPKSILPQRTDDDVLRSLVYNPSLTPELLNILTQDPCIDVRVALIRHHNLTEELWRKLAQDEEVSVRKAIASSANAPVSILETLSQDNIINVRLAVASNNNTPSQTLEQLSQDTEATVRTKVANNSNTAINVLESLASDKSVEVRRAVANNKNSSEAIKKLLKDLLPVAKKQTQSLSPTLRGLSRIYNPDNDDLSTLLSEYINSDVPLVRFVSLLHPLISEEILSEAVNSTSWIERYAVANNLTTPKKIKQQLSQDSNQIVRAVARDNLAS